MKTILRRVGVIAAALAFACGVPFAFVAFADTAAAVVPAAPSVHIDLGSILTPVVQIVGSGLAVVAAWAVAKLPPFVQALMTEQVLKRAIDYGVATVNGAMQGKEVNVPIANDVIRAAAQYAADHAPALTAKLGDQLGEKLVARLSAAVVLPANTAGLKTSVAPVLPG